MKNEVITLVTVLSELNESGFQQEKERHTLEVMAEVKSARQTEFYQAIHEGMKVEIVALVNEDDYRAAAVTVDGRTVRPSLAIYEGTTYKIVRDWMKVRRRELSLQEVE
ncbi:MAG: phage head closure protein [Firmicutes bacterium]|nr:phage head closure protein [Bacillota bacterium]